MRRGASASALWVVLWATAAPASTAGPGGEALRYFVDGDQLVFTNVAEHADARPVPGFEKAATSTGTAALPATIYDPFIKKIAADHGVSPRLVKAVAMVESAMNPHAVSPKGAQGLMQLMPRTAASYGVGDAFDPIQNLRGGTAHLSDLLDQFDGDVDLALAAYNAGAGAVRKYDGIPDYPETIDYVRKVRDTLDGRRRPSTGKAHRPPARPVRVEVAADGSVRLVN